MGKRRNGGRKIGGDTKWNEKRGSMEGREKEKMREKMDREGRRRQRVDLERERQLQGGKGTTQTGKGQARVLGAHAQHSSLLSLSRGKKRSLISERRVGAEQKAAGGLCYKPVSIATLSRCP